MIKVFSPNDKTFTSNCDAVINPLKVKVHKEDNGKLYLDIEADLSYVDILTANKKQGERKWSYLTSCQKWNS